MTTTSSHVTFPRTVGIVQPEAGGSHSATGVAPEAAVRASSEATDNITPLATEGEAPHRRTGNSIPTGDSASAGVSLATGGRGATPRITGRQAPRAVGRTTKHTTTSREATTRGGIPTARRTCDGRLPTGPVASAAVSAAPRGRRGQGIPTIAVIASSNSNTGTRRNRKGGVGRRRGGGQDRVQNIHR